MQMSASSLTGRRGPINILLVEPDDAFLMRVQIALRGMSTAPALYHVKTENDMLLFLRKGEGWENAPQPDIIFLDVSLAAVLDRIKEGSPFAAIPVIMLGANMQRAQAVDCYARYANACVPKPQDQPGMRVLAAAIDAFWFRTAKLPPNKDA